MGLEHGSHKQNLDDLILPQTYDAIGARDGGSMEKIVDLERDDSDLFDASPHAAQKARIRALALSKTMEVLPDLDESEIVFAKLVTGIGPIAKIKNAAGFRILDFSAAERGEAAAVELVTVLYMKRAGSDTDLVPVVFSHQEDGPGAQIKAKIDAVTYELYGAPPIELIKTRTAAFFEKMEKAWKEHTQSALDWCKDTLPLIGAWILGGIAICGVLWGGCKGFQAMDRSLTNSYIQNSIETRHEVEALQSIADTELRLQVMDKQIVMGDYQSLLSDYPSPEVQIKNIQALPNLISLELQNPRLKISSGEYVMTFKDQKEKRAYFAELLVNEISSEKNANVRAELVKVHQLLFGKAQ